METRQQIQRSINKRKGKHFPFPTRCYMQISQNTQNEFNRQSIVSVCVKEQRSTYVCVCASVYFAANTEKQKQPQKKQRGKDSQAWAPDNFPSQGIEVMMNMGMQNKTDINTQSRTRVRKLKKK